MDDIKTFSDALLKAQATYLGQRAKLMVPCTKCSKPTSWDEAKWIPSDWSGNDPLCLDCYESLERRLENE